MSSGQKMKLPIKEPGNREQLLPFEDLKVRGVGFTNTSQLHQGLGYINFGVKKAMGFRCVLVNAKFNHFLSSSKKNRHFSYTTYTASPLC